MEERNELTMIEESEVETYEENEGTFTEDNSETDEGSDYGKKLLIGSLATVGALSVGNLLRKLGKKLAPVLKEKNIKKWKKKLEADGYTVLDPESDVIEVDESEFEENEEVEE